MIRAVLYDADGHDREVDLSEKTVGQLKENQLLWVDAAGPDGKTFKQLSALLKLKPGSLAQLADATARFTLENYGDYVQFDLATATGSSRSKAGAPKLKRSHRLDVAIGPGWVLTSHKDPIGFLDEFRNQDRGETLIGALTAADLATSLLDWHLTAYLTALEEIELFADKTDLKMLSASTTRDTVLQDLVAARRYVSDLRRALAPQSAIFYGLSRPDVALVVQADRPRGFTSLERRFERVLDSIEHGRELVQGSFDLFTTRTAETTNTLIRRLTFTSIMLGAIGGVAGVFGMNFDTPYGKTGLIGFWTVLVTCFVVAALATVMGRLRKWI